MANSTTNDTFVRWMLGISATVIVALGSALFSTTLALREDMAVIKSELTNVRNDVATIGIIQNQIADHEYRLQWIERTGNNPRTDGTKAGPDTLRRFTPRAY